MDESTFLLGSAIVGAVALYAAFATRAQLRNDWPARKIRVRDGRKTEQGPFRALEHSSERDVGAGPPWPVHLTALLGHGISPLSFFVTVGLWIAASMIFSPGAESHGDLPWLFVPVAMVAAFVLGRHQWRGSTVSLTTDYAAARAHTGRAVLGRIVVDVAPLLLVATSMPNSSDLITFVIGCSIPTVHALLALLAVVVSKRHYEAAAVALEERRLAQFGVVPP
jgi:hypothetical protein